MSRPFLARRRRGWLYALLAAAVLVIAVAAGLVIQTALSPRPAENFRVPAPAPLTGAGTASPRVTGSTAPLPGTAGPLRVLQGRNLDAGGVRTGFPDTLAGAVSAAVQDWSQIGSDLDPARAAVIGRDIADPSWNGAPAALAAGVRNTRRGLGLPAFGPVPAGTSVTLTAVDYQVRDAAARQVTVLLLAYYTTALPGQQAQTSAGVYPAAMHWARGGWKILAPAASGPDWSGLDAQPGSPKAAADGWQPLDQ